MTHMWKVQYKPNNDIQSWSVFACYGNKAQAFINASRVSSDFFMVEIVGPDGGIVWSHYN